MKLFIRLFFVMVVMSLNLGLTPFVFAQEGLDATSEMTEESEINNQDYEETDSESLEDGVLEASEEPVEALVEDSSSVDEPAEVLVEDSSSVEE